MRTVADHQAAVRALVVPLTTSLGIQTLPANAEAVAAHPADYADRILAEGIFAPIDLPAFDNSQMDGYAVRTQEVRDASAAQPVSLAVAGMIAAGDESGSLPAGQAAPIMTGAPVPAGADAVIPIEDVTPSYFLTDPDRHAGQTVQFARPAASGAYIRMRGSDILAGELLLDAGTRLGPAQWGVLASSGIAEAAVRRRIRILIVSTGQELSSAIGTLEHGALEHGALEHGRIHDANAVVLAAAVQQAGASAIVATVSDDADDLLGVLRAHARDVDLVVTTGGVSKGAFEVVRQAVTGRGAQFVSVAIQPGGPQGLGLVDVSGDGEQTPRVPIVAFPGNPVSALISFEVFLRPLLREAAGFARIHRPVERFPLANPVDSPRDKHQVRRGLLTDSGRVEIRGGPGSHLLHAYATSSILVHLPAGMDHAEAGTVVDVWRIDE